MITVKKTKILVGKPQGRARNTTKSLGFYPSKTLFF